MYKLTKEERETYLDLEFTNKQLGKYGLTLEQFEEKMAKLKDEALDKDPAVIFMRKIGGDMFPKRVNEYIIRQALVLTELENGRGLN